MDTQEFLDNINSWIEFYSDVRDPELVYPASSKPDEIKWEESMLKIAASFKICDSLAATPAQHKIEQAVALAVSRNRSSLKDIYDIFVDVAKYLGENINK